MGVRLRLPRNENPIQDTFNWNNAVTPLSIEFHWHMELFSEAVLKSLRLLYSAYS